LGTVQPGVGAQAPATPAAHSNAPQQQQQTGGDAQTRAEYDAAFQKSLDSPSDPDVLAHFADLAVQVGDMEGAISALERLLLLDGDQPDVKLELGVLYYRLGSNEAARMYLEAARSSSSASNETKERAGTFLNAAGH
jgi:Flp pilus assembly protein TadD